MIFTDWSDIVGKIVKEVRTYKDEHSTEWIVLFIEGGIFIQENEAYSHGCLIDEEWWSQVEEIKELIREHK